MIYDLINSIIYVIIGNLFFSVFFNDKGQKIWIKVVVSAIWAVSGVLLSIAFPQSLIVRIIASIILNFIVATILYDGKTVRGIVSAVLFYVIVIGCDLLIVTVQKRFDPDLRIDTIMQNSMSVYMGVVSQLLQLVIVLLLRKLFRDAKMVSISSKMWIIYLIFPLYSISLIVLIGYSYDGPINVYQTNVFTYVAISLLILNLLVYLFIKNEIQRTLLVQKDAIEISHAKEIQKMYEQITDERDILGKREHEYKNTITALH